MTEADALGVSKAAVSAWLSQLTSWLCLKKANHAGLDTPKARSKTVHRCGESAQADAPARRRREEQNKRPGQPSSQQKKKKKPPRKQTQV